MNSNKINRINGANAFYASYLTLSLQWFYTSVEADVSLNQNGFFAVFNDAVNFIRVQQSMWIASGFWDVPHKYLLTRISLTACSAVQKLFAASSVSLLLCFWRLHFKNAFKLLINHQYSYQSFFIHYIFQKVQRAEMWTIEMTNLVSENRRNWNSDLEFVNSNL